jgi:hypothetical protein
VTLRLSLLDEVKQAVEALPPRFDGSGPHWSCVAAADRLLLDAGRDMTDALRRFELTVTERSRPIEKEWYRDALTDARDWLAAMDAFETWQASSGFHDVAEAWHQAWVAEDPPPEQHAGAKARRRLLKKLRRRLASVGDPTAPGWHPPWRYRVRAAIERLNVAAGNVAPEKPKRRTVYVPLKGGDLRAVTAEVHADRTAQLPEFGLDMLRWQFPPKSRVQCEWRPVDDRTALVAVALAHD